MIRDKIRKLAKQNPKRIVYPESTEPRTLKAIQRIIKEKIAKVILLGNEQQINKQAKKLKVNIKGAEIVDPAKDSKRQKYIDDLYELRKKKMVNRDEAKAVLESPNYYGAMMVQEGDADGMIYGAIHPTPDTVKPALQIIKTKPGITTVSGAIIMEIDGREMVFADIAVVPYPTPEQLAEIAETTAMTAKMLGIKPKVAMLSFSTKGSSQHEMAEKIKRATELAKERLVDVDGEMQADAALSKEVAKIKCPDSKIAGNANVFIFPNLDAGNIGYKLVQRFSKCEAIGPILQGLNKPVNDLSRGCNVEEIVDLTAYTVVQAQNR
jgi:phosphate acetyltransferase